MRTVAATCACGAIRKTSRAITQLYDAALQPSGLRVTQFTLLIAVTVAEAHTLSDLADRLVMDRTTLVRDLRLHEEQGLVAIAPGRDRRTRSVTITEKGRQMLAQALPLWKQAQARVVAGLGDDHLQALRADLASVVALTRVG
jgi:DNA-binding MarR family transcriptional regulator